MIPVHYSQLASLQSFFWTCAPFLLPLACCTFQPPGVANPFNFVPAATALLLLNLHLFSNITHSPMVTVLITILYIGLLGVLPFLCDHPQLAVLRCQVSGGTESRLFITIWSLIQHSPANDFPRVTNIRARRTILNELEHLLDTIS